MKTSVTFRTDSEKRDHLDAIASSLNRDRSYVLNEAIDQYLDLHRWQEQHIREGQRQAQAGEFVSESEWRNAFDRHRR